MAGKSRYVSVVDLLASFSLLIVGSVPAFSQPSPQPASELRGVRLGDSTFNPADSRWTLVQTGVWKQTGEGTVAIVTRGIEGLQWLLERKRAELANLEDLRSVSIDAALEDRIGRKKQELALIETETLKVLAAQQSEDKNGLLFSTACDPFTWNLKAGAGIAFGAASEGRSTGTFSGALCTGSIVLDNYAVTNTGTTRDYKAQGGTSVNLTGSAVRLGTHDLCGRGYSFLIVHQIGFTASIEVQNPTGCF
jgi:hypothetical protein